MHAISWVQINRDSTASNSKAAGRKRQLSP